MGLNKGRQPQSPIATPPQGIIARLRSLLSPSSLHNIPSDFTETYTNDAFHFSFKHPPHLRIQVWPDGTTTVIRARDAQKSVGFQICIRPLGGPDIPITAAQIARDLPHVAIKNPAPIRIRGASKGLAFYATDAKFGESFQVWFTRAGHLYQISSLAPHDALVRAVFSTWAFKK